MTKRQVVALREAWWVWVGEEPAIRVESEAAARQLLLAQGKDYAQANSHNRSDMACAVAEITWNEPLPEGQSYHKVVWSPACLVLHNGGVRQVVRHLAPSKLAATSRSWMGRPGIPAWWPDQFNCAVGDPDTLVLRGKRSVESQLGERWRAANSARLTRPTEECRA